MFVLPATGEVTRLVKAVVIGDALTNAGNRPFEREISSKHHTKVVNGQGAVRSRHGARYNYPGATTVYLADTPETCFAEKMFYFHRKELIGMEAIPYTTPIASVNTTLDIRHYKSEPSGKGSSNRVGKSDST